MTASHQPRRTYRRTRGLAATLAALTALAIGAAPAYGAFGENYDIADINTAGNQTVPAYPGTKAFWAGACDLGAAPAPGQPIPGGVGVRPEKMSLAAPKAFGPTHERDIFLNGFGSFPAGTKRWELRQPAVDSPVTPPHCIDYGVPNDAGVLYPHSVGNFETPATPQSWEVTPNDPEGWWTDPVSEGGAGESPFEPSWRLAGQADAGGHPDGTAAFAFKRNGGITASAIGPDGSPDNLGVALPPGFAGNPTAVPKCTAEQFAVKPVQCPPASQVGVATISLTNPPGAGVGTGQYPVYNLEPREGYTAELGIPDVSRLTSVRVVAKARTASDFGVTGWVTQIPAALPVFQQALTLWGVPWAPEHDLWRMKEGFELGDLPWTGLAPADQASYDPSWGEVRPFLSNITGPSDASDPCDGTGAEPVSVFMGDTFQKPGVFTSWGDPDLLGDDSNWVIAGSPAPALAGCDAPRFEPDIALSATTGVADGASGLDANLALAQNNDPRTAGGDPLEAPAEGASQAEVDDYLDDALAYWRSDAGRATSHLKDTVVQLPAGVSVNPSGATGLRACSDSVVGVRQQGSPPLFNNVDPFDGVGVECPDGSKIGTVEVDTPLLEETLHGDVVLGEPKSTDPQSGEMFRLFLVVRSKARNLVGKIYGSTVADPGTGRLTATFANNPQLPVDEVRLEIKGGDKGLLAMPQRCGSHGWSSVFTGWSRPAETVPDTGAFTASSNCGFGFAPSFHAGVDRRTGGGTGTFGLRFSRQDGQQWLSGLTATLPQGLLADVGSVDLCSNAQANAASCPASSRIGTVDASAGSGDPFVLERKGSAYLTEGYKGAPYGMAVVVPVEAGPFRGAMALRPIVVRQAIHVDRRTAQVTAVSDPFPLVHHGIPLRVREVLVNVDRPNFMLNPSDCSPKQIKAEFISAEGTRASAANHFQASDCDDLAFKPRLNLALKGRRQVRTGKHPGVRAVVRQQGISEAGIQKAEVRLPKSLALDPDNAQELCEFDDGTKPDLENHCPKGSIVGRARARTPLLKDDLVGDVYFVKNVRIDEDTGNEIRTLPMIVVALRGEIAINLVGESSTTRSGKLVNTFDNVPDAPISQFNLNIKGGKNGILAVTRTRRSRINLCAKPRSHVAEADFDGQNGKRHDFNVRMNTPCRKRRQSAAKVCRKRTDTKQGFRRCVTKVKRHRAQKRRAAQKRKAAKRSDRAGGASRG